LKLKLLYKRQLFFVKFCCAMEIGGIQMFVENNIQNSIIISYI